MALARALDAQGRGVEAIREARTACEFAPEVFAFHTELLALAKKHNDNSAREWAALTILRGDWLAQSGSNWAVARGELDALKAAYRNAGEAGKIADLEKRQREAESTDIVAVMSWNTNGNDIDLHVEEPGNQNVSYNARSSFRGGNLGPRRNYRLRSGDVHAAPPRLPVTSGSAYTITAARPSPTSP